MHNQIARIYSLVANFFQRICKTFFTPVFSQRYFSISKTSYNIIT